MGKLVGMCDIFSDGIREFVLSVLTLAGQAGVGEMALGGDRFAEN